MLNVKKWITSDLHFGDDNNVILRCGRPCTEANHIEFLIARLNHYIKPGDHVYHIGDLIRNRTNILTFDQIKTILHRLNGIWYFIIGNHDDPEMLKNLCDGTPHKVVGHIYEIEYESEIIILCHYPIEWWHGMERGAFHFHGHTHFIDMPTRRNRFNVCFDREFKPYLIDDLLACRKNRSLAIYDPKTPEQNQFPPRP